jgi:hypothetical protein
MPSWGQVIIQPNLRPLILTQSALYVYVFFFCGNLCVQWLPFCDNLYIVGEVTNMQNFGGHSNLNG